MNIRKSKFGRRAIFSVESLESRTMLAGNSILPFAHLAHSTASGSTQSTTALVSSLTAGKTAAAAAAVGSHGSCHGDNATTSLTGTLADPNNASATGTATSIANGTTT